MHAGVDTHAQQVLRIRLEHGLHWRLETHQATCRRQEVAEGVFCIDATLNGPTVALHIGLGNRQFFAIGHTDHHLNQVDAGNGFSDGVLHLQAGVHFEEVEALVFAHHKLHRTSRLVFDSFGQGHGLFTHGFACGIANER